MKCKYINVFVNVNVSKRRKVEKKISAKYI